MDEVPDGRRVIARPADAPRLVSCERHRVRRLLDDLRLGLGMQIKRRRDRPFARPPNPARAASLAVAARAWLPLAWRAYRAAQHEQRQCAVLTAGDDELARATALAASLSVAAE